MRKILSMLAALVILPVSLFSFQYVSADTVGTNFESYVIGTINGQDGWSSAGAAGSGCAVYDHVVGGSLSTTGFGSQSLRISNAVTSGCFGDQTFSKSLVDEAGETSSISDGMSGGSRKNHFEVEFNIASSTPNLEQVGLSTSISPDRGDGARMSYLRFEDKTDGIHVFFDDYQDVLPYGTSLGDTALGCGVGDDFIESDISTLNRSTSHKIKISMDFVDGTRNDIVKIYIDGVLVKTGTSWEDYFRYCEGNPTRTVDSMIFRTGGTAAPLNLGKGFLFDNFNLKSFNVLTPTTEKQCKKDGWKNLTDENGKSFKNQGQCVSWVEHQKDHDDDHDNEHKGKDKKHEDDDKDHKGKDKDNDDEHHKVVLVDTITLNSNSTTGVNSNVVLDSGKNYKFEISGTWANRAGELVDAKYTTMDSWATNTDAPVGGYLASLLDVQLNNGFINWGTYSAAHTYNYNFVGSGSAANFRVFDGDVNTNTIDSGWYGDNVGTMTIKIYKL